MNIGNKIIDSQSPCFIIAEIGINHNKDICLAKKLIDIAKEINADAVKFQSFIPEDFYSSKFCPEGIELLNKYILTFDQHKELFDYCKKKDIIFLSTPFEFKSAKMLNELGVDAFKIASGEINYFEFLKYIAAFNKPMIVSTGSSSLSDVEKAKESIYNAGNHNIAFLHCVSAYPAPDEALNLKAIQTLKCAFPSIPIGFSDHSTGIEAAITSVVLGANIVEKHFTLDKNMDGPDHIASSDPDEFKAMIDSIKRVERMLGDGVKRKQSAETRFTRSLMSIRDIKEGEEIKYDDIVAARPPGGLDPDQKHLFVGRKAVRFIFKDELLNLDMI